ncbi:enhanced level of genomic instability 1 [Condylostylus longicornis]|uniref:enhanced level of genomic instability 1 n=1 Tax=Condylostylus longicornis TaxID=2530218 RepID=UPI00244E20A4|nr:enhanced level of genomic instability 1 [Condylostylus longicornis]
MNTIVNYFESPTKNHGDVSVKISAGKDENGTCKSNGKVLHIDQKTKKSKNQEIVKNMEEVLNLVKKQHRNKHKNKAAEKRSKHHKHHKSNSNESDECNRKLSPSDAEKEKIKRSRKKHKGGKPTIQDMLSPTKKGCESFKSSKSEVIPNGKHIKMSELVTKPVSSRCSAFADKNDLSTNSINSSGVVEDKKTVNAFEFLMSARNKSIGSNSPGKESPEIINVEVIEKRNVNLKRKLMLEEWADRRGGKKRKLKEAAREQYIEEEMDKRAIRLKEMIENQPKKRRSYKKMVSQKLKQKETNQNDQNVLKISKHKKNDEQISENKSEKKEENMRRSVRNSRKLVEINNDISSTDDFLMNLSSPIKGRQDLYGYFGKTTPSPTEKTQDFKKKEQISKIKQKSKFFNENLQNNAADNEVPKRGRKKKEKLKNEVDVEELQDEILTSTPRNSERPRRSCVGKARYDVNDYELDSSFEKNKTRKKIITINIDDDTNDVVDVDSRICITNDNKEDLISPQPKKLAPLFVKAVQKTYIDPERLKARQDFLMSGIPEKMRIDIAKMKQFEQNYELYNTVFPRISHVPSWVQDDDSSSINLNNLNITWRIIDEEDDSELCSFENKKSDKCIRNVLHIEKASSFLDPLSELKSLENKRILIKEWKNLYDKFPTYKCYNQLREKYRYFSAMDTAIDTQEITESFIVSTRRNREIKLESDAKKDLCLLDNIKPPTSAPNGELLFCDKYKPLVSEQILVNVTPVYQLKEFLSNWQNKSKTVRSEELDSSFDCTNDTSSNSDIPNCVVLVGPTSCGKTNAVFALANELNFNVLEINAGMKRSGKKLLQNLQEATQSHQIRKDSKKSNLLLKRSLSGLKKIKDVLSNENSLSSEPDSSTKMSLILVEDADILFENHDQGFVDAIYQLVGISKRPVVILANDKNCQHLQRLINQNYIEFTKPHSVNISKFLTILSLMENCPIHLDDIVSLYYFNKMDLRKTILEMQFFIQSGGDRKVQEEICTNKSPVKSYFASPKKGIVETDNMSQANNGYNTCKEEDYIKEDVSVTDKSIKKPCDPNDFYIHRQLFEFFTASQNIRYKIPFPINFDLLWVNINEVYKFLYSHNEESNKSVEKKNTSIVNCTKMEKIVDFYDSISLASNVDAYNGGCGLVNSVEQDISHYLVEKSIDYLIQTDELSYNLFDEKPKPVENILSHISPGNQRSKRSIALDFEPMLRSICRSEKSKSNQKRVGTRYYHYLRNIAFNLNSFSLQLFDDVCPIFVDDQEKFIEYKPIENNNKDWLN